MFLLRVDGIMRTHLSKKGSLVELPFKKLEREKSLELSTYTLARYRSTN